MTTPRQFLLSAGLAAMSAALPGLVKAAPGDSVTKGEVPGVLFFLPF